MKKIFAFSVLLILFLIPVFISAQGLVNCGNGDPFLRNPDGSPAGTNTAFHACTIADFFAMLQRVYNFLVLYIATPVAVLAVTIGAGLMMLSAANPNLMATGRKILILGIVGLVLAYGSWLIVNIIMTALGYRGNWSSI